MQENHHQIIHMAGKGIHFQIAVTVMLLWACGNSLPAQPAWDSLKVRLHTHEWGMMPVVSDHWSNDPDSLRKGIFVFHWNDTELALLRQHEKEIHQMVMDSIVHRGTEDYRFLFLAAWLRYPEILHHLKNEILYHQRMYGWEGPSYEKKEDYLYDEQYPWQMDCLALAEWVSGKPASEAIVLSAEELESLRGQAKECNRKTFEGCYAEWLLGKLGLGK